MSQQHNNNKIIYDLTIDDDEEITRMAVRSFKRANDLDIKDLESEDSEDLDTEELDTEDLDTEELDTEEKQPSEEDKLKLAQYLEELKYFKLGTVLADILDYRTISSLNEYCKAEIEKNKPQKKKKKMNHEN